MKNQSLDFGLKKQDVIESICMTAETTKDAELFFDMVGFPKDYRRMELLDKHFRGGKRKCA